MVVITKNILRDNCQTLNVNFWNALCDFCPVENKMSTFKVPCRAARPLMSTDYCEARRRALGLYRAIYRYIPYIVKYFDIPKTEEDCRCKLRERFYKNACVTDMRVIDLLVIKGYMDLKELTHNWQQKGHVMAHWNPSAVPKPCDFLGKFYEGMD